ncbi:phage portal protein [Ruoffia sp. FAM 24228]|uniref:phage portal protein n=1 Tax=Ruoffia sp. FAM 24228 TaxID=3259517 RepID=UPI003883A4B9
MIDLTKYSASAELTKIINQDLISTEKKDMKVSKRYYEKEHDILDYRLFYVDSDGVTKEEKNRSNIKIPYPFYTEIIDQKVNYLLGQQIEFKTNNEQLESLLKNYIDPNFHQLLNDLVEGASLKGREGVHYYYDSKGMIRFEIADSYNLIFLNDEYGELSQVIRHYTVKADKNGKQKTIQKAEVFTAEGVYYFVKNNNSYAIDKTKTMNPQPYRMLKKGDTLYKPNVAQNLPILLMENNKQQTTDLNGIKDLIDNYDLNASSLSNNLQEFDYPIYAVRGFEGDSLDNLVNNLQTRKTIGVSQDGGLDVHQLDVKYEARKAKLDIDKEAIYRFSMSFDSSGNSNGDRALTNIGIKSRYSLLDIKANKTETRLRKVLNQMLELILENIKELTNQSFDVSEIEVVFNRSALTNEKELAEQENLQAQALLTRINAVMNTSLILDSQLLAELLAKELGLESDEVIKLIKSEDYIEPLNVGE